jgi:hypothetical protein
MTVVRTLVGQSASKQVDKGRTSAPKARRRDELIWRKGSKVLHPGRPEWGMGTVLANGDNERLEVRFACGGDRILCPSLSGLQLAEQ